MDNDRKKRLLEIKKELQDETSPNRDKDVSDEAYESGHTEGDDINRFIKEVVERKKARKQQLEIVHDFFENPAAYGVDTDIIPSSTTENEIEARKHELQHKIDLLRSVLKALEGEMQLLCQVRVSSDSDGLLNDDKLASAPQTVLEKKAAASKQAPRNRSTAKKPAKKKK